MNISKQFMLLSEQNVAYHCSKSLGRRNEIWVIAWNDGNKVLGSLVGPPY